MEYVMAGPRPGQSPSSNALIARIQGRSGGRFIHIIFDIYLSVILYI